MSKNYRILTPLFLTCLMVLQLSCGSKQVGTSSKDALTQLESKYSGWVGKATKSSFVEDFGQPQWCSSQDGEESCRFYKGLGTKWVGQGMDKKSYPTFDEVLAQFDENGILKSAKYKAQR